MSTAVLMAMLSFVAGPAGASPGAPHADRGQSQGAASIAVQLFASKVETLGAAHYADSFAGAVITPAGLTKVYALTASDGPLIHAIDAMNHSQYPVEVIAALRSFNQLNALSAELTAANNTLKAHGVVVSQASPDPETGSITVNVVQPTASAIMALSVDQNVRTRIGTAITTANYQAAASALLNEEVGQGFTVESQYLPAATIPDGKVTAATISDGKRAMAATPLSRTNDTAPFVGGDYIFGNVSAIPCTGSFFVTGNRSGHTFLITAGHCSQFHSDDFDIYPTGTGIGPLSTNYWVPGTENDFLTIYVPDGAIPYVWGAGTSLHPVQAALLPAKGTPMTFNGAVTGEIPGNTVTAVNATDMNVEDSNSGRVYNIYPVVQATPPQSTVSCQKGDSGGPAYVRTPSSPVDAVGSIAAFFGGVGITLLCSAQQIGYEEATSNTTLMTTG